MKLTTLSLLVAAGLCVAPTIAIAQPTQQEINIAEDALVQALAEATTEEEAEAAIAAALAAGVPASAIQTLAAQVPNPVLYSMNIAAVVQAVLQAGTGGTPPATGGGEQAGGTQGGGGVESAYGAPAPVGHTAGSVVGGSGISGGGGGGGGGGAAVPTGGTDASNTGSTYD
jgi:hypothetical protein